MNPSTIKEQHTIKSLTERRNDTQNLILERISGLTDSLVGILGRLPEDTVKQEHSTAEPTCLLDELHLQNIKDDVISSKLAVLSEVLRERLG